MNKADVAVLQAALGYKFGRPELLERALTHSSHAHEEAKSAEPKASEKLDNEQLEFLGDATWDWLQANCCLSASPLSTKASYQN